jgi:hypothetical protein
MYHIERRRNGLAVTKNETVPCDRMVNAEGWVRSSDLPSTSMACPEDLEHKAPEESMKKTWLSGPGRPIAKYRYQRPRVHNSVPSETHIHPRIFPPPTKRLFPCHLPPSQTKRSENAQLRQNKPQSIPLGIRVQGVLWLSSSQRKRGKRRSTVSSSSPLYRSIVVCVRIFNVIL